MNKEKIFKDAVNATNSIKQCFQVGLRGLGTHSKKIKLGDTSKCEGSVDIDSCLAELQPQSSRWDYCFSYKGEVFFVEVHGAITSEVSTVLKKLDWLKNWLKVEAPEIDKLKAKSQNPFYWIQSSNFTIPPTSKQFRTVIQAGIKPIPLLELA